MPDNRVRHKAAIVGHNSFLSGRCPMSGANIQSCIESQSFAYAQNWSLWHMKYYNLSKMKCFILDVS